MRHFIIIIFIGSGLWGMNLKELKPRLSKLPHGLSWVNSYLDVHNSSHREYERYWKLSSAVPVLRYLDFVVDWRWPENYPEEVIIRLPYAEIGYKYLHSSEGLTGIHCDFLLPFGTLIGGEWWHHSTVFPSNKQTFGIGVQQFLWEERENAIFPIFWVKGKWLHTYEGGTNKIVEDALLFSTGFDCSFLGTMYSLEAGMRFYEEKLNDIKSLKIDPLCRIRIISPNFKFVRLHCQWSVEKYPSLTKHCYSIGISVNPKLIE
jgi:hypothetical protein